MPNPIKKLGALVLTLGVVVSVYGWVARPWFLSWGATEAERAAPLPGDEIVPEGRGPTRAIEVAAPADSVWPWLAQLGQDRAGFYSFEVLEDLAGCDMPRTDRILPGAQEWHAGDSLWMYPPDKLDGVGGAPLLDSVPGRALAFGTWRIETPHDRPPNGSWAFVLEPVSAGSTRLIVRSRGAEPTSWRARWIDRGFFEAAHFVMERRMMEGIRHLAEGRQLPSRASERAEVLTWAGLAVVFAWGLGAVLRRERWVLPLAVTGASALGFQLVTLVQPPALVGGSLLVLLAGILLRTGRPRRISSSPRAQVATRRSGIGGVY